MRMWRSCLLVAAVLSMAGCGGDDDDAGYHPDIDPARFSATIDNPYLSFVPGTVFRYTETTEDATQDVTVTVTDETRDVMGVTCVVVHDVVTEEGDVLEETFDWYAQDADGSVWYFGEDTTEYDGELSSKAGSWEAGVDGGQPGIVMLADPAIGDSYRQEYLAGEAEDMGEVVGLGESASVPYGDFDDCLRTRDTTALEPDQVEEKVYCRDVGEVQSDLVQGGVEHEELVSVETQ